MQYSVAGLKAVLEFILEHIGNFDEQLGNQKELLQKYVSVWYVFFMLLRLFLMFTVLNELF